MTDDPDLSPSEPFAFNASVAANGSYFDAMCAPLHDILVSALPPSAPPVVDLLSVDAEGAEIEIFRNFPFHVWDIRCIVVETSRRTTMAIDGLLLPHGFLKIAVLGKDAVYVSRAMASSLPADRPLLPERILWNEPGSDADTIEYLRFQRLFGVDGDLDEDIGDQRLDNETELARQAERQDAKNAAAMADVKEAVQGAAVGGILSDKRREALELPWVKEMLKEPRVKSALAMLLEDEAAFVREVQGTPWLRDKIASLLDAGVIEGAAAAAAVKK